jgi:hypothetical protein
LVLKALPVLRVPLDLRGRQVRLELQARKVYKVSKEFRVRRVKQAQRVLQVLKDLKDRKEKKAIRGTQVLQGLLELLGLKDHRATLALSQPQPPFFITAGHKQ